MSEEDLLERLDEMVSQRTSAVEAKLREQYDSEIEDLRQQLDDARRQQLEAESRAAAPVEEPTSQERATEIDPLVEGSGDGSDPAARTDAPAESVSATADTPFPVDQPPSSGDPTSTTDQPLERPQEATPPPTPSPSSQATRRAREGELVSAGPGVTRPVLTRELKPRYPDMARRLNREGVVTLEVLVDEEGRVVQTRLIEGAGSGFDEAAIAAAKRARFEPATKDGVRVRMWTRLRVNFENDGN